MSSFDPFFFFFSVCRKFDLFKINCQDSIFCLAKKKLDLCLTIFYFFLRSLMMIVFLVMGVCVFLYLFGKYLNFCLTDGIAIVTSQFKFGFQVGTICLVSKIHPGNLHISTIELTLSFEFTFVSHKNFEKNYFFQDSTFFFIPSQNKSGTFCS